MKRTEICINIRALEAEQFQRRKAQALVVAVSLFALLVLAFSNAKGWGLYISGLMILAIVIIDVIPFSRKTKVICKTCKRDLVLGLSTNYELLENKCSLCGGEIYDS